ncbi:AraC family transcriptional regulator [Vibrio sp.]|nr:AraC family transcriptional regulator [Vibrio sp.]
MSLLDAVYTSPMMAPRPAELVSLSGIKDQHDHAFTQVVIGLKGRSEFDVSGYGNIVHPGQGCVVSEGADHAFGSVETSSDVLVLNMFNHATHDALLMEKLNDLSTNEVYFKLDEQVCRLIRLLTMEMQSAPNDMLLSKACNDTLIAVLHRHMLGQSKRPVSKRFDLDAIDHFIHQNITHKMTVNQLAGTVHLAESQFYALFKQKTGMTPHQYVLDKRMQFAKSLMQQPQFNLGQIAELSGFSSQSAFTNSFSKSQGLSPAQYRNQL